VHDQHLPLAPRQHPDGAQHQHRRGLVVDTGRRWQASELPRRLVRY